MFEGIRSRFGDMGTIKRLCETAEAHAAQDQQRETGAEHFLLAALDLPDGTARRAFDEVGVQPEAVKAAIERQYSNALRTIGIEAGPPAGAAMPINRGIYRAAPSGQEVMQALADTRSRHRPLLGAHVVSVIAGMPDGVAARALRALDVDLAALKSAADALAGTTDAA